MTAASWEVAVIPADLAGGHADRTGEKQNRELVCPGSATSEGGRHDLSVHPGRDHLRGRSVNHVVRMEPGRRRQRLAS